MTRDMTLGQAVLPSNSLLAKTVLVLAGTVLLALSAQIEVPMLPIPMSLQTLAVSVIGLTYGARLATLTVTPHEIQGDFVALDYSFNFSNFTGSGSVGVPPPRTTNSFSGQIEVPDGHTVIVGGLVTENEADSVRAAS